jgi:hypothetical protein
VNAERSGLNPKARITMIVVLAVLAALLLPAAFAPAKAHAATHDPVGSLDSVTASASGTAVIFGWAADPDVPTSPLRVEFSDNGAYRTATIARTARPDVASAFPQYGATHGFLYSLALADGSHTICAEAINSSAGADVNLGCKTITLHNNPVGTASTATVSANTATITGTATDANSSAALIVRAYRDGSYVAGTMTDARTHSYTVGVPVPEGSHKVCVYLLNVGAGANTQVGCQIVLVRNNPFGAVETAGQTPIGVQVKGWALDLNTTNPIGVQAYLDGAHVADQTASLTRADIGTKYPTVGANHGYLFTLAVAEGTHTVCIYASNVGPGVRTRVGCATVAVHNNPVGRLERAVQVPGGIQVSGYAIDFNASKPIGVHVYVDGRFTSGVVAANPRGDLPAHYPTAGPDHGFSLVLPITSGTHTICVYAINVGPGSNTKFSCGRVAVRNNPVGSLAWAIQYPGGVKVNGWTLDPDATAPIGVQAYVDGHFAAGGAANLPTAGLSGSYPYNGTNHSFQFAVPMTPGSHNLCLYGLNVKAGSNVKLRCVTVIRGSAPVGASTGIARVGSSTTISLSGWAVDPDTLSPVALHVYVDGRDRATLAANSANATAAARFPLYGSMHGFKGSIVLDAGQHSVCAVAFNVGAGSNLRLGCSTILTSGDAAPAPPTSYGSWPGSKEVTLTWTAPRSANAPITGYLLTVNPGNRTVPVPASLTSVVASKLTNGVRYTFTLRAKNRLGVGSAASTTGLPTNIPPQVTPAPVSTSHYIRNITGNLTSDAALLRSMGAADAARNPSGHSYLILLQIGGQDEADHGALLSATARFVTYPAVVSAMKAYLDGYATRQKPYAPLTLAIGTNNDVDVSSSAGISWARNIVNPVAAYAAARHPGVVVAGANDMEPGFSASVGATRAWLSGYLSATSARFVFNGSADGCSTGGTGSRCNNGWSMSDLQWLSGGASPARTISLPQIYNHAMPLQWKYISLTGVNAGRARINFGGPLTEYTACVQAGSCGSVSNTTAWSLLWSAISSTSATRQPQMPNGTDLRIN